MSTEIRNEFLDEMGDYPVNLLRDYLASQDIDWVSVIELGDELIVSVKAADINGSIKSAEMALMGSLTSFGDYEITDLSRMVSPIDGTIVSSSLTVTAN
jgi:hypothetical protein